MYADPARCPDCSAQLDGTDRCASCGLALHTPEAARLWHALVEVDDRLREARAASARGTVRVGAATAQPLAATTATSLTAGLPSAPGPARTGGTQLPPVGARWSAGGVILALGALCLIVAGVIFVGIAWGSLGVGGRAAVLVAVTALVALLATLVTRRRLRGSAEALWAVTLGLVTVDWFAAVGFDLLGLGAISASWSAVVWSVLTAGLALLVVRRSRAALQLELMVPSVVAGLSVWGWSAGCVGIVAAVASDSMSALAGVALVAALLGWTAMRGTGLRIGSVVALVAVGVAAVVTVVVAVVEACVHPTAGELVAGHGLPLLLVSLVLVGVGVRLASSLPAASTTSATLGGLAAVLLVALPIQQAWPDGGVSVPLALVTVAATWLSRRPEPLPLAGRIVAGATGIVLALLSLPWAARTIALLTALVESSSDPAWTARLPVPDVGPTTWPAWAALVTTVGLVGALLGSRRWPEVDLARSDLAPAATWVGALGLLATVTAARPTLLVLVVTVAILSVGLLLLLRTRRGWRWTALATLGLAPACGASTPSVLLVLAVVTVLVAAGLTCLDADRSWRWTGAGLAVVWTSLGLAAATDLVDLSRRMAGLTEAVLVLLLLAVAAALRTRPPREGVEVATLLPVALSLSIGAVDPAWAALLLTVLGAGGVAAGLVVPDRRLLVVPGSAALGLAYVLRLVASDVSLVEAYTLPFAAVLLLAGAWAMRSRDQGSVALLPGLGLASVPTLVLVLADPVSVRGLILGVAAVGALLLGLVTRWRWPLMAGAGVVAVIAIRQLGPEAAALPRWVLIAVVGAVLLGVGVTWDRRVQDGRAAVRWIRAMR